MSQIDGPQSAYDFGGLGQLKAQAAKDGTDEAAIQKAAQQFEGMFLQMMLKSMRASVPEGGLLNSQATKTFEQMYDQQIVMAMTERGSTGIAEMVENFIRRTQSSDQPATNTSFSLDQTVQDALPLNDISARYKLPEGATQQFLLNRQTFRMDGGDQ